MSPPVARFRLIRQHLAPSQFTEGEAQLVGYSLDIMKDAMVERLRRGLMARFPQNNPQGTTTAPSDALGALGRDRRVVRGIGESLQSYARRLVAWLDDRKITGNPFALMQKLAEYTGPGASFRTVDVRGNWFSRAVDGTRTAVHKQANWDWDESAIAGRWSKFWVIIYPPSTLWVPNTPWALLPPTTRDALKAHTRDCTATPEQAQTIRALVEDWKPGGTRCVKIIVSLDPTLFDPAHAAAGGVNPDGHFWREYKSNAGAAVRARFANCSYWDGT